MCLRVNGPIRRAPDAAGVLGVLKLVFIRGLMLPLMPRGPAEGTPPASGGFVLLFLSSWSLWFTEGSSSFREDWMILTLRPLTSDLWGSIMSCSSLEHKDVLCFSSFYYLFIYAYSFPFFWFFLKLIFLLNLFYLLILSFIYLLIVLFIYLLF